MTTYHIVIWDETTGHAFEFECAADDYEHAHEQALSAYPAPLYSVVG